MVIMTLAVCCACDPEPTPRFTSGFGMPRSLKKVSLIRLIVMLSGVDQLMFDISSMIGNGSDNRSYFHEVRPRADNAHESQRSFFIHDFCVSTTV